MGEGSSRGSHPIRLGLRLLHGQAAAILEVAEGTVKSRCFRGRAALAQILGTRPGEAPSDATEPERG